MVAFGFLRADNRERVTVEKEKVICGQKRGITTWYKIRRKCRIIESQNIQRGLTESNPVTCSIGSERNELLVYIQREDDLLKILQLRYINQERDFQNLCSIIY